MTMTRRYGLAQADWRALAQEMRQILIGAARMEKTIAYSELAAMLKSAYIHYRAPAFGAILRDIAAQDEAAGRPTLATLVVNKATGRPGAGYFKQAVAHGWTVDEIDAYWQANFRAVCDYWQAHDDEAASTGEEG